jgi:hypothetical protein
MKYIQALCLAFALTTCGMSVVVYGQLSYSNQNSCLIIGFRNITPNPPSRKYIKNPNLRKVQEFFDYANIPLEISYVRNGSQFEADNNLTFVAALPSNSHTNQLTEDFNTPQQLAEGASKNDSVQIVSAPLKQDISIQVTNEDIEKPILRHPKEFVND